MSTPFDEEYKLQLEALNAISIHFSVFAHESITFCSTCNIYNVTVLSERNTKLITLIYPNNTRLLTPTAIDAGS